MEHFANSDRQDVIANTPGPSPIDDPEKYQTGFRRFFALIIDGIAISILAFPFTFIYRLFAPSGDGDDIEFVLGTAYFVGLTARFGKTLGKHLCKVEVVSYPGEGKIGWKESIKREIVPVILAILSLPMAFLWELTRGPNPFGMAWALLLLLGGLGWNVLEIVTYLLDPKRRAFHDKIAGTVVVRTGKFGFMESGSR